MIPDSGLVLNATVFDWCLTQAWGLVDADPERSAQWCLLAADMAVTYGCSELSSAKLEACCLRLGGSLPALPSRTPDNGTSRKWLHVFTETSAIGGHTALAKRWIMLDASLDQHSVVTTFQPEKQIDADIVSAVEQKGGRVESFCDSPNLLDKAQKLRALAASGFDAVVLHVHMWDIVPAIAFACPSQVPVVFVNHADHSFWVGTAITDLLLSLRESGKEFASRFRGLTSGEKLAIPLESPKTATDHESSKRDVLSELAFDAEAVLILTVGSHFKYEPIEGAANFFSAIENVLVGAQNSVLLAVGPQSSDARWMALKRRFPGRVAAVGPKTDLDQYYAAADLYVEGFPFGSLTALLEAGLRGVPCVRAPSTCPAPYKSDGDAIDFLLEPTNEDAYSDAISDLIADPAARKTLGERLRKTIAEHHCGAEWSNALAALKENIPRQHSPKVRVPPETFSEPFNSFWASYLAKRANVNSVAYVFGKALARGLKPKVSFEVARAIAGAKRVGMQVPSPAIAVIASRVLSVLPSSFAERLYRAC